MKKDNIRQKADKASGSKQSCKKPHSNESNPYQGYPSGVSHQPYMQRTQPKQMKKNGIIMLEDIDHESTNNKLGAVTASLKVEIGSLNNKVIIINKRIDTIWRFLKKRYFQKLNRR